MHYIVMILGFLLSVAICGFALHVGAKILKEEQINWPTALTIALIASLFSLIPVHGLLRPILSWVVMLVLLKKVGGVSELWPSGVLLVVIAGILQNLIFAGIMIAMMGIHHG